MVLLRKDEGRVWVPATHIFRCFLLYYHIFKILTNNITTYIKQNILTVTGKNTIVNACLMSQYLLQFTLHRYISGSDLLQNFHHISPKYKNIRTRNNLHTLRNEKREVVNWYRRLKDQKKWIIQFERRGGWPNTLSVFVMCDMATYWWFFTN